ncbi:DUF1549 domain-containing protein [Thalassoglobus neptunius]|uniref:DUF1549 domain-containing protein n=1 Tax=Thalassoglobus neptunius TaxID=1938619 RepID=UPI0018D239EA|nr:DUF1549 domain-containing protein [Thalassoglobus neptunius]
MAAIVGTLFILPAELFSQQNAGEEEFAGSAQEVEFFEKKIRPILVKHCYECHSADSKSLRGGLLVDNAHGLTEGGDSGPAIVAGNPAEGTLMEALRYETFEMPPRQQLPEDVIEDFEEWIRRGAVDPRTAATPRHDRAGIDLEKGREFWSFQPVERQTPPSVQKGNWPSCDIDRFILARLEEENLEPFPPASELILLRRLFFDLTGLPPSVAEIRRFQEDTSESRLENVVDRLLLSPEFGRHWGRHWLDLARYSDSTGGGRSMLYGSAWRYRNYVIDAFNRDTPYDEFVRQQIAGDLMEADDYQERQRQLVATGFLVLGPHNYENQDKEQLRMDIVDEQVDTIGRVFLGMTIGCARCHDHKFDPIPTADYYALAGIFRSTHSAVDGNVSKWVTTALPQSPDIENARQRIEKDIAQVQKRIQKLSTTLEHLKAELPSIVVDDPQAMLSGIWKTSESVGGYVGEGYRFSDDPNARARFVIPTDEARYEVQISYTSHANRTPRGTILVDSAGESETFEVDQRQPPELAGSYQSVGEVQSTGEVHLTIQSSGKGMTIVDSVRLIKKPDPQSDASDGPDSSESALQFERISRELTEFRAELEELKKQLPETGPLVMSVSDEGEISDYAVCIRGNVHQLGEPVERGFLSVIDEEERKLPGDQSGRLELADWIASPENPLTARVYVNRIWHHLFGTGLVRTVDNFGLPGEVPSHPELLDHLAIQFIEGGWSTKELIRKIVLSRTYQLASGTSHPNHSDPDNRLLSRQNRRRLNAESIHDALLMFSGELSFSSVEDSVRPGTKSEYGYQFDFGSRAVFLPVFRNRLPDLMSVFDFPDPNLSIGNRVSSTVSPQSLFLMNSEFILQRANATAQRVLEIEGSISERLQWAALLILNRELTDEEEHLLAEAVGSDPDSIDRWSAVCATLMRSIDFRYLR